MSDEWVSQAGFMPDGFSHAAGYSTVGYRGHKVDPRRCTYKDKNGQCRGFHKKDSPYCAGHARRMAKQADS